MPITNKWPKGREPEILADCLRASRLSSWIYTTGDLGQGEAKRPPLSEEVNAVVYIGSDRTGTQGAAIVTAKKIFFVFRGTESPLSKSGLKDWKTNAQSFDKKEFHGIKIHKGFAEAAESVAQQVANIMDLYGDRQELEFNGHSLGGAVAVAVAVAINELLLKNRDPRKLSICTIGQPRLSRTRQLNLSLRFIPYVRVQNGSDIVPRVPKLGYSHGGELIYIPNRPGKASKALFNPSQARRFSDRLFSFRQRLADHKTKDYIGELIGALKQWLKE